MTFRSNGTLFLCTVKTVKNSAVQCNYNFDNVVKINYVSII